MKQTIAKKLRELRGNKRQKEIAAALGVKVDTYEMWERGINEPSASFLVKIRDYYNLSSVDRILTD